MRFVKPTSSVVLAAMFGLILAGISPATALSTALCSAHQEPCAEVNRLKSLHLVNQGNVSLLTDLIDILCLHTLVEVLTEPLGFPQHLIPIGFLLAGCGSTANHNNCTLTVEELPFQLRVEKTGLNLGTMYSVFGQTRLVCAISGFIKINCLYSMNNLNFAVEGALHKALTGQGMFTAEEETLELEEGGFLCPESTQLDGLLVPLAHTWVVS